MLPLATFAASAAVGVGKNLLNTLAKTDADTMDTAKSTASVKARKTADDFEKMFLEDSLEKLTQSKGTEGPMGENGIGGGVWRSMMTKEYANAIVKTGGVGISNQVYSEMMRMQEAGNGR
ncbi:UNVERIFIED_ORG: flagellar protein FlgJ [Methylobacterium sp. SuP10 SLI 274]|uniref:rod-binding protein n=1 Tax=Methylorubrum extorquens TaxID=408 RepID=UPI0020A0B8BB|nr:rod-binding protein [Methylorubrum extorquens]MDF9864720.1 flagellar protein FlgJ [Methylorubrum pseudosasae]MDH6638304.1 flagellar protein FlgJ [Methylobacterium sp. SuP10 SLI 274]MDH6667487.1 flagellar protein FlgJ [Methylorubrum zatmanii]MCP1559385.1 Rod binding domain-containing protein [Methylorubrum extorquens]MDF9793027.1 flagellar protein FlgJ [Methylorubrum extorquens]